MRAMAPEQVDRIMILEFPRHRLSKTIGNIIYIYISVFGEFLPDKMGSLMGKEDIAQYILKGTFLCKRKYKILESNI